MSDRDSLLRAVNAARDGREVARAVAALDAFDRDRARHAAADRELDLGVRLAAQRLTPVPLHEHHTAATDWLADAQAPGDGGLQWKAAIIAEASTWYGRLDQAVRADAEELGEQARGRARTIASAYASPAAGEHEFLQAVAYLHSVDAASGLPQIDQTVDANNAPSPTPYPVQVFPTFGEEQDPFNGMETDGHASGASSQAAPMLQLIQQQDAGGSGYGAGPERQLTHDTGFDNSMGYAEVPLGAPGIIPATMPGQGPSAQSAPTPLAGMPQDAGAQQRQAALRFIEGYSLPDPFGYRWAMTTEVMHPFHERCGSAHWPEESCEDRRHTASVAVGYMMNLDQARRQAQCEKTGVQEGLRAVAGSAGPAELGAWHNRVTSAWGASDRTADDTAVLHGFQAVVRPVLAETAVASLGQCTACSGGDCGKCDGKNCSCSSHRKTAAKGLAAGGGVTESERQHATHHLPGTDKFPVSSAADVENGKHDIGRTDEPHGKVVRYLNQMAKEYHVAPVGK